MEQVLLEQLLFEDESATLDFKRDQYKFVKVTEDNKSELLKDILGFANRWRRSDAYILIGVEEVRGGRSTVVGTTDHLDDHSLQQFVNSLTNSPVRFGYEVCTMDDKQIGVICVELQNRPVYLKRDFGKLKRGEVYVRRGSSTDRTKPANPEEIAQMGERSATSLNHAELYIGFANPKREDELGTRILYSAEFCDVPERKGIPILKRRAGNNPLGIDYDAIQMSSRFEELNKSYYKEVATYEFVQRLYREIRFIVTNLGTTAANDVRVEITVSKGSGLAILETSHIPERPRERRSQLDFSAGATGNFRPVIRRPGDVHIDVGDDRFKLEMDCGNIQPGRKIWSDVFHVGVADTGEFKLDGHFYSENLPEPKEFALAIDASVTKTSMTVDELIDLAHSYDEEPDDEEDGN